jgi:uncharacterized protein (TIGR03437 family)
MDLSSYGGPMLSTGLQGAAIVLFDPNLAPEQAHLCVTNAANFRPDALAAGALVSLYGSNLGPVDTAVGQPDENGRYPTNLAGTQVLLNGDPIPLITAQQNQINAWIPPNAPSSAHIEVQFAGLSQTVDVQMNQLAPGLFRRFGTVAAAADNEDGSANGADHPAPLGSIVRIYGTGFGIPFQAPRVYVGNQTADLLSVAPVQSGPPGVYVLQVQVPQQLPPAFQSVANLQFRYGLYILQTNLFIWVNQSAAAP